MCVAPLPYNESHNWNFTKNFLRIWKDNDITHDMAQLQAQISAVSKAHVESISIEDLTQSISSGLWSLNPVSWLHWIIVVAVPTGIIILLLLTFPIIFRLVFSFPSTANRDIYELRLKNKKGRDAHHLQEDLCAYTHKSKQQNQSQPKP